MEVAISGGRHSASGASSSEGGLVIDLSKMRHVKVDTTTNRIIAQGGCLWADIDSAAAKYELATGYSPGIHHLTCSRWNGQSYRYRRIDSRGRLWVFEWSIWVIFRSIHANLEWLWIICAMLKLYWPLEKSSKQTKRKMQTFSGQLEVPH